jgi:hypothetical protein
MPHARWTARRALQHTLEHSREVFSLVMTVRVICVGGLGRDPQSNERRTGRNDIDGALKRVGVKRDGPREPICCEFQAKNEYADGNAGEGGFLTSIHEFCLRPNRRCTIYAANGRAAATWSRSNNGTLSRQPVHNPRWAYFLSMRLGAVASRESMEATRFEGFTCMKGELNS